MFLKCLSPLFVYIFNQAMMAEDQEFIGSTPPGIFPTRITRHFIYHNFLYFTANFVREILQALAGVQRCK